MTITIYHNPRCSKSRQTLAILEENTITPDIRLYLDDPLSATELKELLSLLRKAPRDIIRRGEAEYKESGANDPSLDDDAIIALMVQHPKLIERPIVVHDGKAVLGRPPENVLQLID